MSDLFPDVPRQVGAEAIRYDGGRSGRISLRVADLQSDDCAGEGSDSGSDPGSEERRCRMTINLPQLLCFCFLSFGFGAILGIWWGGRDYDNT